MADPIYDERPTDELRQVLVESLTPLSNGAQLSEIRYYRVQRKWLVFDTEAQGDYIRVWSQSEPGGKAARQGREVWRDLPIVSEAEARA